MTETTPVLIAGDFNNGPVVRSGSLTSLAAAQFDDALGDAATRGRTSLGQLHPIDWIFVKNIAPLSGRVVESTDASDHFPLVAALESVSTAFTHR